MTRCHLASEVMVHATSTAATNIPYDLYRLCAMQRSLVLASDEYREMVQCSWSKADLQF